MGTSWISRKGGNLEKGGVDLEKGGMTPLINYAWSLHGFIQLEVMHLDIIRKRVRCHEVGRMGGGGAE